VVRSRNQLLDQHHPGASRHPSSAEEGSFADLPIHSQLHRPRLQVFFGSL